MSDCLVTERCVVCGEAAGSWSGHVHHATLGNVSAGWCGRHGLRQGRAAIDRGDYNCNMGCLGHGGRSTASFTLTDTAPAASTARPRMSYKHLIAVPSSYNDISTVGNFVRTVCPRCHLPGPWRKAGTTPVRISVGEPFNCRTCQKKLSDHTIYIHLTQEQMDVEHKSARQTVD